MSDFIAFTFYKVELCFIISIPLLEFMMEDDIKDGIILWKLFLPPGIFGQNMPCDKKALVLVPVNIVD